MARDYNIVKSYKKEINMNTRSVSSKVKYSRNDFKKSSKEEFEKMEDEDYDYIDSFHFTNWVEN